MNTECSRIADQLRRAFDGNAWHGPALKELLADVKAEQAYAHSVSGAHSIWELVLHITVWTRATLLAMHGTPMPKIVGTVEDWPVITDSGPESWQATVKVLFQVKDDVAAAIEKFGDARLTEIVPGRKYDFYYLFHGIVQHSLYHGGQIALLKK
jgi:uncharacterized damage-inducible protein DinB